MPGYDRTGPAGRGSMTGGRRGGCAGSSEFAERSSGRRAFGKGNRSFRNRFRFTDIFGWKKFNGAVSSDEEINILNEQAGLLKKELDSIEEKVKTLLDGSDENE